MTQLRSLTVAAPVADTGSGPRSFLRDTDLSAAEQRAVLDAADGFKRSRGRPEPAPPLAGRTVALLFEKPSTRTRLSFDVAVAELGGHPLPVDATATQIGRGETAADTARTFSGYVHALVVRTFGQDRLEEMAAHASVPVVNALTDAFHPCQALADLQTIRERLGALSGIRLAYVGDGNNVAHSLLLAGALSGLHVVVASPPGFEPDDDVVAAAAEIAGGTGGSVATTTDRRAAAEGAQVLYTDVWASMGQEAEAERRRRAFAGWTLDAGLVALADPEVVVLHCLPAHRGEEIAADVIDGPRSAVFEQAANRLHTQKALLCQLLAGSGG